MGALIAFSVASWGSTYLLVRAAVKRPIIGALVERAGIAVLLSLFGSVCVVLVWNTDTGHAVLDAEAARVLFRGLLVLFLLVPPFWLVLFGMNRLGGGQ